MNAFIDLLLGKTELPPWWEEVYSEYIGLRENKSASFILQMIKDITYLKSKVFIVDQCIKVLATQYNRDLVNELKLCGCRGTFDWSKPVQYSADIKAAHTYSMKYVDRIARKEKELEEYKTRNGGASLQRKDFDIWAVTLGKFMGYRVDLDIFTVSEWCHALNMYEKYCEVSHAEQNNMIKK